MMLQEDEKAEEGKVKNLQRSKDDADKANRKFAESRATDKKKQEHAQVCVGPIDSTWGLRDSCLASASHKQGRRAEEEGRCRGSARHQEEQAD